MPTAAAAMLAVHTLFRLPALAIILVVLLVDDPGQFGGTWKMNVYRGAALAVEPDGALWATIDDVIGGTAGKWVLAAGFTAVTAGLLVLAGLVHRGGHAAGWQPPRVSSSTRSSSCRGCGSAAPALVESADLHAVDLPDAAGAGVLAVALIAVPVVRIVGIVPVVAALVLEPQRRPGRPCRAGRGDHHARGRGGAHGRRGPVRDVRTRPVHTHARRVRDRRQRRRPRDDSRYQDDDDPHRRRLLLVPHVVQPHDLRPGFPRLTSDRPLHARRQGMYRLRRPGPDAAASRVSATRHPYGSAAGSPR